MFPAWNMLYLTQQLSHHKICHKLYPYQCRQLSFSTPRSSEDEEEKEDFQMVPLNNEHWTSEEIPKRTLCIHEHGLPHGLCPYPCTYANYQMPSYMDSLDLSDISDFEDYMVTYRDKDIPALRICLNERYSGLIWTSHYLLTSSIIG